MKMLVTLEVEFSDMSEIDREISAEDMGIPISELPKLADYEPYQLANLFNDFLAEKEVKIMLFEGTDIYVNLESAIVSKFEVKI